jgi:ABC-type phosphate transport system substrate-binding protein
MLSAVALFIAPVRAAATAEFRVIVNPQVKGTQIPKGALSSIFLRQAPHWADGSPVLPVDQSLRSPVRRSFSADILDRGLVEVQMYWAKKMSSGVTPPPVKTSDAEVVAYVASTPGAIGYVSADAAVPASVREIAVIN